MNEIDVRNIDLNLLVALDALLAERSVTAAARRLGVGQPAASHALARLRELFGDPLLVRAGRSMAPTPRAEALQGSLTRWLAEATRLVAAEPSFDPQHTTRTFALRSPDLLAPVVASIVAALGEHAPAARLEVTPRDSDDAAALQRGETDLALGMALREGGSIVTRGLGEVHFGVIGRAGHPALARRKPSVEAWLAHPHVVVRSGSGSKSIVEGALQAAGRTRSVGLVVPTFLAALVAVSQTDLLFAAPVEFVRPLTETLGLVDRPTPIPIPPVPIAALWPERLNADPGHRFFRGLVVDAITRVALRRRRRSP